MPNKRTVPRRIPTRRPQAGTVPFLAHRVPLGSLGPDVASIRVPVRINGAIAAVVDIEATADSPMSDDEIIAQAHLDGDPRTEHIGTCTVVTWGQIAAKVAERREKRQAKP